MELTCIQGDLFTGQNVSKHPFHGTLILYSLQHYQRGVFELLYIHTGRLTVTGNNLSNETDPVQPDPAALSLLMDDVSTDRFLLKLILLFPTMTSFILIDLALSQHNHRTVHYTRDVERMILSVRSTFHPVISFRRLHFDSLHCVELCILPVVIFLRFNKITHTITTCKIDEAQGT